MMFCYQGHKISENIRWIKKNICANAIIYWYKNLIDKRRTIAANKLTNWYINLKSKQAIKKYIDYSKKYNFFRKYLDLEDYYLENLKMWNFYDLNYDINLSINELNNYSNLIIEWLKKRKKEIKEKEKLIILKKKIIQDIKNFHSAKKEQKSGFFNWFFV